MDKVLAFSSLLPSRGKSWGDSGRQWEAGGRENGRRVLLKTPTLSARAILILEFLPLPQKSTIQGVGWSQKKRGSFKIQHRTEEVQTDLGQPAILLHKTSTTTHEQQLCDLDGAGRQRKTPLSSSARDSAPLSIIPYTPVLPRSTRHAFATHGASAQSTTNILIYPVPNISIRHNHKYKPVPVLPAISVRYVKVLYFCLMCGRSGLVCLPTSFCSTLLLAFHGSLQACARLCAVLLHFSEVPSYTRHLYTRMASVCPCRRDHEAPDLLPHCTHSMLPWRTAKYILPGDFPSHSSLCWRSRN